LHTPVVSSVPELTAQDKIISISISCPVVLLAVSPLCTRLNHHVLARIVMYSHTTIL
jgi:hypothetical protein